MDSTERTHRGKPLSLDELSRVNAELADDAILRRDDEAPPRTPRLSKWPQLDTPQKQQLHQVAAGPRLPKNRIFNIG
jgi:hypothetical protein